MQQCWLKCSHGCRDSACSDDGWHQRRGGAQLIAPGSGWYRNVGVSEKHLGVAPLGALCIVGTSHRRCSAAGAQNLRCLLVGVQQVAPLEPSGAHHNLASAEQPRDDVACKSVPDGSLGGSNILLFCQVSCVGLFTRRTALLVCAGR